MQHLLKLWCQNKGLSSREGFCYLMWRWRGRGMCSLGGNGVRWMLALLVLFWPCMPLASLLHSNSIGKLFGLLWPCMLWLVFLVSHSLSIGTFLTGVSGFPNGLNTPLPIVGFWLFRCNLLLENISSFLSFCFSKFYVSLFMVFSLVFGWTEEPKIVLVFCFVCMQGNPIDWVSTHRYHHQFCDSERDPHSPTEGFWFSHMSWLFDTNSVIERVRIPCISLFSLCSLSYFSYVSLFLNLNPLANLLLDMCSVESQTMLAIWRNNHSIGLSEAVTLSIHLLWEPFYMP